MNESGMRGKTIGERKKLTLYIITSKTILVIKATVSWGIISLRLLDKVVVFYLLEIIRKCRKLTPQTFSIFITFIFLS